MKSLNRKFLLPFLILNIVLWGIPAAYAGVSYDRYINNDSSAPWTFTVNSSDGNVYFLSNNNNLKCPKNGPCTIPGSTKSKRSYIKIQYTSSGTTISGTVYIRDYLGATHSFAYHNGNAICGERPYIIHSGNTGSVSVNDPACGDFTVDHGRTHW